MADDIPDVESFLAHYGRKGMKWGVVKEDPPSGGSNKNSPKDNPYAPRSTSTDIYANLISNQKQSVPNAAELAKNNKKFVDKFDDSSNGPTASVKVNPYAPRASTDASYVAPKAKKLTAKEQADADRRAKTKKIAIGVGVVGGLVAAGYLVNKYSGTDESGTPNFTFGKNPLVKKAGQPVSLGEYKKGVAYSKLNTWGGTGYVTKKSLARAEFELPSGHTFNRITTNSKESGFNAGTYATHSTEDFNRYIAAFRGEKGGVPLHHVTFTATKPIKVPNLSTAVDTLREVMDAGGGGKTYTHKQALDNYKRISGGSWTGQEKYFAALQKKGYGALVDEMDAGVIGETPLVVFAKGMLSEKSIAPLSNTKIKQAEKSLVELDNRHP